MTTDPRILALMRALQASGTVTYTDDILTAIDAVDPLRLALRELRPRLEAQAVLCGACDAGLAMSCAHPAEDPRAVIADVLAAIEETRTTGERNI